MTKADTRKAVLDVWARAGRQNFGVPVEIVNVVDELPADLQAKAVAQGWVAGGIERFFGAYHEGRVYIVASEHRSAKEVQETVYHEVYGHAALETLMGGELRKKMAEHYHKLGAEPGIAASARPCQQPSTVDDAPPRG